jgi:hypothetical protein
MSILPTFPDPVSTCSISGLSAQDAGWWRAAEREECVMNWLSTAALVTVVALVIALSGVKIPDQNARTAPSVLPERE